MDELHYGGLIMQINGRILMTLHAMKLPDRKLSEVARGRGIFSTNELVVRRLER